MHVAVLQLLFDQFRLFTGIPLQISRYKTIPLKFLRYKII